MARSRNSREIVIPTALWKRIGVAAVLEGISRSEFVRRAVRTALDQRDGGGGGSQGGKAHVVFVE